MEKVSINPAVSTGRRTVPALRWWIGAMLFASTVINYTDRQTLSLLAPFLKQRHHWDNSDYATIIVAFRVAYAVGQALSGRLMDRLGTKNGLTVTVLWYSIVSVMTPLARGLYSFTGIRFLLGLGESGNWPGATKAVSEWFPSHERALATALFDGGSSIGAAIAPFLILPIYFRWGMGPVFVVPGVLGFIWLIGWRRFFYLPNQHPRISESERRMIAAYSGTDAAAAESTHRWQDLLRLPQTWGVIAARALTDPVFFFIADWFAIYLVTKGISLRTSLFVIWIPFVGVDLGNVVSGLVSGYLIRVSCSVGRARKLIVIAGGLGSTLLIPTIFTVNLDVLTALFFAACFSYGLFTTIANVLPSDIFLPGSVASVSGMSGSAAALCTIIVYELAGHLSDARRTMGTHSFDPLIVLSGVIPCVGMVLVLLLVRNTQATEAGILRRV